MNLLAIKNVVINNDHIDNPMNQVVPVIVVVEDVTVTRLRMAATSQLLDLQLQIQTISSQQLAVLLGQLLILLRGSDLLTPDQVNQLQHLETDLVHQTLGVLGQQHDLLQVQGVAQAPHWLPGLDAAVPHVQLRHLVQHSFFLQSINIPTLLHAELPDAVVAGSTTAVAVVTLLL